MSLEKLTSFQELEQLIKEKDKVLFLKNSTTCPVSHEAFRQYEKFADELEESIYYLNVQESRPFSNEIAERFAIKHESPQVLLFNNDNVAWHTSHWNITYKNLKEKF
jgi:bacillithiol system protein YtxJ